MQNMCVGTQELVAEQSHFLAGVIRICDHFWINRAKPLSQKPVKVFAGFVLFQGERIQVDFQVPKDATDADKDAAFLATLAQHVEMDYLEIGESDTPLLEYPLTENLPGRRRA